MGEVYRARDVKLHRDVALKVLPAAFAEDPDRIARFRREARVLAALNHQNIAAIYGLEEADGVFALALELVEGPTLADRLVHGPLLIDEAKALALQIVDALEAAHERGIVHRDLKPANVKQRADGAVKVLDFGLAKALDGPEAGATADGSPTITSPAMTRAGMILGTAAYMSPEQAKGREADRRSDVWAFGAVLYEMLSGTRAFKGDDVADTLGSVLRADPDWTVLPVGTPSPVRRLLRRCLQKDPRSRLQHIGDARLELNEPDSDNATGPARNTPGFGRRVWPVVAAAVAGAAAAALFFRIEEPPEIARPVSWLSIQVPEPVFRGDGLVLAVSPDGRTIVYTSAGSRPGLVRRRLGDSRTEPLPGGEGGTSPFFSPDGAWIGFLADGRLKKIPATGGAPVPIADVPRQARATWADDDTIVVARPHLYTVSASSGALAQLFGPDDGQFYSVEVLPHSKIVLVEARRPPSPAVIEAVDLRTRTRRKLVDGASPRLAPNGDLLFVRQGKVWGTRFDSVRAEIVGSPVPVGEFAGLVEGDSFAVAPDGSFFYMAGPTAGSLVWLDRTGAATPAVPGTFDVRNPRLSPDGTRVAVGGIRPPSDLQVFDLALGSRQRLTTEGFNRTTAWSPDGQRIAFLSVPEPRQADDSQDLYVIGSRGGDKATLLLKRPGPQWADSWSRDGRYLIFDDGPGYSRDLWVLPFGEEPRPIAATRFNERSGTFAPDSQSFAFVSDESGRDEIYVQSLRDGTKIPISGNGGLQPVWARDGQELYYREGDVLMAVPVRHGPFRASPPRRLFDMPSAIYGLDPYGPEYDVAPDGRFLAVRRTPASEIQVILNWTEELRRALR